MCIVEDSVYLNIRDISWHFLDINYLQCTTIGPPSVDFAAADFLIK